MKRLIWIFLLASASSQTFNTNIIPAQTGLSLGRQGQRWNLYANNLDITGSITVNGSAGHFTIFPLFGSGHTAVSTDLTSSTPGQCAFWIAGNMLGQGPCLTAVPTPTLGDCAIWATTTTLSSLPCSGGGGSGDIKSLPVSTQTITQPQSTTLAPNNLQQVRYATNYQWSQSPTSPATIAIGANTVTINGVLGVNAYSVSKVKHYLWIATQGTPERVLITATTCTGVNTGTCTVTFTAAGTHSAGYTLGTATGGWQEAWVDAFPVNISNPMVVSKIMGSPTNINTDKYRFNATFDIDMQRGTQNPIVIDGQGSVIECNTPGMACIEYGMGVAGTLNLQPLTTTIENFLFIPAAGLGRTADGTTRVIHDHGQGLKLKGNSWGSMGTADYFDYIVVVEDDEAFVYDSNHTNPGNGLPMLCDTTWCGTVLKGNSFSVGSVMNSDFQMTCRGNAIDWTNNTLGVSGSIIQSWSQFAIRFSAPFPNFGLTLSNNYFEAACTNPIGTGNAAVISRNGFVNIQGGTGPSAIIPSFLASAVGATQFNYWVVAKSSTLGTSTPLYAGKCLSNGTGTCTVKFPEIGTSGTMTWDLIRLVGNMGGLDTAPYTAITVGGAVSTPGSVATGITTASRTSTGAGNYITVVDDVTASTSSYTVTGPATFFPRPDLWPGLIILGNSSDTNNLANGTAAKLYIDRMPSAVVSMAGRNAISVIGENCGPLSAAKVGYVKCNSIDAVAGGIAPAEIKSLGAAAVVSRKGLTIYESDPANTSPSTDIITLSDSNQAKTAATPGNRPTSDANDTAIGYDQANVANTGFRLGFRAPIGHRWYVGSLFDNSSWLADLSSTLYSIKVPIAFQSGVTYNFSGPEVSAPSSPAAGLQRAYFKAGVGLCAKDSAGVEYCPGGAGLTFATITAGTNTTAAMVVGTGSSLAVSGSGTIAATTAAALASNPTDCGANVLANAIAANGNLTCVSVAGSYMTNNTVTATQLAAQYSKWLVCTGKGMGDGLNAMPAGTYLETTCRNLSGVTVTFTAIQCFTDNNGTSTMAVTNGAGTALLTGAVTCNNSYASGTQSGTTTLANNDFLKFTYVADGTSKQFDVNVLGTF